MNSPGFSAFTHLHCCASRIFSQKDIEILTGCLAVFGRIWFGNGGGW